MLVDLVPGEWFFQNVKVIGVYDGDTIYLDIDKGHHHHLDSRNSKGKPKLSYRLLDIDAPELKPLVTRQAGTEARDYLAALIDGKAIIVKMLEDPDSFGRYLVWIWLPDGTDVNRLMLDSGHAVPYSDTHP
jgi:endonuclease YncB( thermonuclease family)